MNVMTIARSVFVLGIALTSAVVATTSQAQVTQTLSGTVTDTAGLPLVAAIVRVVEPGREEVTGEGGRFTIGQLSPGRYTIVVRRIGYRPVTRTVELTTTMSLEIRMEAAALVLPAMVVTGTLGERALSEVLSPTTVLAADELNRRLGATVAATLSGEPGVSFASMGPATARPVVRGMGGDRVLILEDGVRPGDLSSTSPDHALSVDPLTAAQFEVVRGPKSLIYGSSALGGVVNVIRNEIPRSLDEHTHATFTSDVASVNRGAGVGGVVRSSIGRVALRAEASWRAAGNVRTPDGALDNTDLRTYSVSGSASRVQDQSYMGASLRLYNNHYGIPGGFVGGHADGVDIRMQRYTVRTEAGHRPRQGPISDVKVNADFTHYYHGEVNASGNTSTAFTQDFASADVLLRHASLGPASQGAVGMRVQFRDITTAGALKTPSTYDYSAAVFAVEEWESGVLHLQAGARYDWARFTPRDPLAFVEVGGERIPATRREFGSVAGGVGALVHATESLQFGASLSRAFRTPDFNELYSDGPHLAAYSYDVGNPRLAEETGIGTDVFMRLAGRNLRFDVAWFRNRMFNYVFPSNTGEIGPQDGKPKFQYVGRDAVLTGAEGEIELGIGDYLVAEASASYVRGTLMSADAPGDAGTPQAGSRYLPLMPPLKGIVRLRYDRDNYFAEIEAAATGKQDLLGDFETTTPGYATLGGSLGVRIPSDVREQSLTLRVENITDRAYRDHMSRVKDIVPAPGRNVSLLFRLQI